METCPFCRADLHHHCKPACHWRTCSDCGHAFDPERHLAFNRRTGQSVEWVSPNIEPGAE